MTEDDLDEVVNAVVDQLVEHNRNKNKNRLKNNSSSNPFVAIERGNGGQAQGSKHKLTDSEADLLAQEQAQFELEEQLRIEQEAIIRQKQFTAMKNNHNKWKLRKNHECSGKHIFVLVHGYQGNSWDMRMFRNHLLCLCGANGQSNNNSDLFLMAQSNESDGQSEHSIEEMGNRLAKEIVEFITKNCKKVKHSSSHDRSNSSNSNNNNGFNHRSSTTSNTSSTKSKSSKNRCKYNLCRLNFVCHSLGGVVARAALSNPILEPFVSQCYTFISLAVCHCGYLFGRSRTLQAGFWVMRSLKKSTSLSQLSLTDNENPRKTFMYQLSSKPGLEYFENVLLVSSPEDRYTPYHSTRIEMHRKTVQDTKWGRIYNEMVRNLLRPLDNVNLTRFDVSFLGLSGNGGIGSNTSGNSGNNSNSGSRRASFGGGSGNSNGSNGNDNNNGVGVGINGANDSFNSLTANERVGNGLNRLNLVTNSRLNNINSNYQSEATFLADLGLRTHLETVAGANSSSTTNNHRSKLFLDFDSMIGRTAHICFLEQPLYIDMLIHVYKQYFVSME